MENFNLTDWWRAFKIELIRFRLWIVLVFIGVSFLILIIGLFWPKQYFTTALLVADTTTIYEPLLKNRAPVTNIDRSEQAREIIYTRSILEAAARKLKIIDETTDEKTVDREVRKLRAGLTVKSEKSNYFRINYVADNPDRAYDAINAIISVFIEDTEKRKREESLGAYNFIDAQVQSYKTQLEDIEEKLKVFKGQNLDGNESTVMNRITQLRSEMEILTIAIEESEARIVTIKQQLEKEGQYQQAKGQADDMRQRRQHLIMQLEQLLLVYQENYPDIISLRDQIKELDTAIENLQLSGSLMGGQDKIENPLYEELRKQLQTANVDLRGQKRRMESLKILQQQEFERAQRIAAGQAELAELTRDNKVIRDVYEDMRQLKESARVAMTMDMEGRGVSFRVQEPSFFPLKPNGIHFLHFALLGPIVGLIVALGLVVAYLLLDTRLRSARQLQTILPEEFEVIGVIPHYKTPLTERLLRKDILGLFALIAIAMAVYLVIAIVWQWIRG